MTPWYRAQRACFDLETTGPDPRTARIVTASLILCDNAGEPVMALELLADPGVEIPEKATEIHGISTEQAQSEGHDIREVLFQLVEALDELFERDIPVIAYNASYDFTVLLYECKRHDINPPAKISPVIDPYVIDKQAEPFRKGKRTLSVLCELYKIDLENAHSSEDDALAALELADKIGYKYRNYLNIPVQQLHEEQKQWKKLQDQSFEEYLKRTGKFKEPIDSSWPARIPQ
ncbi:MAG: 3'-5' exonuclease [Micrococcaceae bacterium]